MKTLDEVITAFEKADVRWSNDPHNPLEYTDFCDALRYLKEYRFDKKNFAEAIHNCCLAESKYITALYELKYGKERDEQRDNA